MRKYEEELEERGAEDVDRVFVLTDDGAAELEVPDDVTDD